MRRKTFHASNVSAIIALSFSHIGHNTRRAIISVAARQLEGFFAVKVFRASESFLFGILPIAPKSPFKDTFKSM